MSVTSKRRKRCRITVTGTVQGVGFRPFVYRLAESMSLSGWIANCPEGVTIEIESGEKEIDEFIERLSSERPALASIDGVSIRAVDHNGNEGKFEIRSSSAGDDPVALILADLATCQECLEDIFDPGNRRYLYPFTNCTNCGPRYSIIESLPYDRHNTSMKKFELCPECRREYENPLDRRFHAQPTACPRCGPHLELWDRRGKIIKKDHNALKAAAESIKEGRIVAVKGLGGFHLVTDAGNPSAVRTLRFRKNRPDKPFALMFPDLPSVRACCTVSEPEAEALTSPAAPIVLLRRIEDNGRNPAENIAPENSLLGIMLPSNPLHHILMKEIGTPIVATSGNLSDEPICIDEREALNRLHDVADLFLIHDRPIVRHVDDSIVRFIDGEPMILRRSRGYVPLPVRLRTSGKTVLAVGGHMKNTIALGFNDCIFISQHTGDLETEQAGAAFEKTIGHLTGIYGRGPDMVAHDLHPDYTSTVYARENYGDTVPVQHHVAHVCSCLAENSASGPVLGAAWDGTGYGPDGTIWGGEFILIEDGRWRRVASFKKFLLLGGDRAAYEPRRAALAVLYELAGDDIFVNSDFIAAGTFTDDEIAIFRKILQSRLNTLPTSSVGRLFDAVASIMKIRQRLTFEGQAAMELEFLADRFKTSETYRFEIRAGAGGNGGDFLEIDWSDIIYDILNDMKKDATPSAISAKFHNTLAQTVLSISELTGIETVALTGGCFQNKYLTEKTASLLRESGRRVMKHNRIPPNDGGLAAGQILAVIGELKESQDVYRYTRKD